MGIFVFTAIQSKRIEGASFRRSHAKHPTYKRFAGTFRSKGMPPSDFLRQTGHSILL